MSTHKFEKLFYSFALMMIITVTFYSQNPIQVENALTGTKEWQTVPKDAAFQHEIEGYASETSVNKGESITFFINVSTESEDINFNIYRLGYYGGSGARLVYSSNTFSVGAKPIPSPNPTTGLAECNWPILGGQTSNHTWNVPTNAVSGVYLVKLYSEHSGLSSYISFVVRDDARTSNILFQRSVTTDQAYNNYPGVVTNPETSAFNGKSLYDSNSYGPNLPGTSEKRQARKVSFNRPYQVSDNVYGIYGTAGPTLFNYDINLIRWLEKNGYDVTYCTDIDTHTADSNNGRLSAGRHKVLVSGGHDEYWSWEMRDKVETARNRSSQPLNLAFIGGNAVYWQIRFENSSSSGTYPANATERTIVGYKETATTSDVLENDPFYASTTVSDNHLITNKWRENQGNGGTLSKPPEDELIGVMYSEVPLFLGTSNEAVLSANCPAWICSIAVEEPPMEALVGYEADRIHNESAYSGTRTLITICDSPYRNKFGVVLGNSNMTLYTRTANGARVFGAGTIQWAWGLDNFNADAGVGPVFRGQYQRDTSQIITSTIFSCLINGTCS